MKQLTLQFQPDSAAFVDVAVVREGMSAIALLNGVAESWVDEGDDEGPYVNFSFSSADIAALWAHVQATMAADTELGNALRAASMVMCEGERGWDDYLLLYHFDPSVERDELH